MLAAEASAPTAGVLAAEVSVLAAGVLAAEVFVLAAEVSVLADDEPELLSVGRKRRIV